MAGISGGGGGSGGYNYVQDSEPSAPEEGEEWYDTGANAAFVYDGTAWIEQTVVDHGQLSGIGASDHHTRPAETENTAPTATFRSTEKTLGTNSVSGSWTGSATWDGRIATGIEYRIGSAGITEASVSIKFVDNSNVTESFVSPGTYTVTFPPGSVRQVSDSGDADETTTTYARLRMPYMGQHNHSV